MFSLVITIISVALVAALALATLYYGGSAYEQSQSRAKAAQVSNQAQQLLGAAELFYAQNGRWNNSMEELVSEKFLKSIPLAQASSLSPALASGTLWTMPMAGQPVFFLASMDVGPCRDVNERAYGMPGILPQLHAGYVLQCFGTSSTSLTTVAGRSAQHLAAVASGGIGLTSAQLASAAVPARGDTSAWYVSPDAAGASASARTIVQNAGYRAWSDGSAAASCNAYRKANGSDSYTGATGDGVYRISPSGTAFNAYCDMTSEGGGWTRIVRQTEQNPITNWNGGVNGASYALATAQIPPHTQVSFGKDEAATFVDYVNWVYTTGDISPTVVLTSPKTGKLTYIHRSSSSYYNGHSLRSGGPLNNASQWFQSLAMQQEFNQASWAFSPLNNEQVSFRGFAFAGVGLRDNIETFAYTVWVR